MCIESCIYHFVSDKLNYLELNPKEDNNNDDNAMDNYP